MAATDEPTDVPAADDAKSPRVSRKSVLRAAVALGATPVLVRGGVALARDRGASATPLATTPQCHDGDGPTVEQTEGPYFKPNSPLRSSLITDSTPGTRLTVTGYVFNRSCRPISGALLDFWQADDDGDYDNTGYTFRGHQFSTSQGAFSLTSIVPGLYPGRTRHIHVKLQAPGGRILTTQLYFPGEPRNNTDTIFDARLLMNVRQVGPAREATYDFVLDAPTGPTTPPTTPPSGTWAAGTAYRAGDVATYAGSSYRCLQAHTAITGWEPPNVPALWQRV